LAEILRPIGAIARALDGISNIEFKELELSRGQYLYLVRIAEQPGIILERLAAILKVDKTTAARAIQKLERNGIVERRPSPTDKKQKQIFMTTKGQALYPIIHRENTYSNQVALQGFTPAERDQLADYLNRVETNIATDWTAVKHGHHRNY